MPNPLPPHLRAMRPSRRRRLIRRAWQAIAAVLVAAVGSPYLAEWVLR